jgi:GNAT superfamily N-acetyltransferase
LSRIVAIGDDVVDPPCVELGARVHPVDAPLGAERDPDEPPFPIGVTRVRLTERWLSFEHRRWLATTGTGEVVGLARLDVHVAEPDDPTVSVNVQVVPPFRRRGIGSALLAGAAADARARGRPIVGGDTSDRVPAGAAFARSFGAEPKLEQRTSHCHLAAVDRGMLDAWLAVPADVAAEYELWRSTGPYPPDSFAAIAEIQNVMNSQPYDDLERRDVAFTAAHVAHGESERDWSLSDRWTHFIRHRPTGRLVGFTRLYLWHTWTGVAEQGDTAVDPAHRGRGLGKWLKGSMVRSLLDERPDIERIRTTNAYTNGPMLAINEALGFTVTRTLTSWQVPTAVLLDGLAARRG